MQKRVAIVINKHDATLRFSETFVRVHIERLPCTTVPVMGITNHRIVVGHHRHVFPSRSVVPLGLRWLARRVGLSSIAAQDRKAMRQFLLRWNIDAVMAEYGPNAVSVMEACHDTGVPLIAHFHGYDAYHEYYIEQFGEQYQRLFDVASATIAVSSHMQQQLLRLGARPDKTFVIPCGADVPSGARADPQAAPPRFVMVGRLTEKKSPLTSIRAFAQMGVRDATLDIVGEGELMDDCRALADSLGIADRIVASASACGRAP
jgi:colanic acid/amylovoran biosynthesis glycosyltransferase